MRLAQVEAESERVSRLMKLLASPRRLLILCSLAEGEKPVGALCDDVGLKPPAMSQHLALLRGAGIVEARRDGQSLRYRIVDEDAAKVMTFLYETFCKSPPVESIVRKSSKRKVRSS